MIAPDRKNGPEDKIERPEQGMPLISQKEGHKTVSIPGNLFFNCRTRNNYPRNAAVDGSNARFDP
jgi:hypothetical protein